MSHQEPELNCDAKDLCIGIAVSRYHGQVTSRLCTGAVEAFVAAGGSAARLIIADAPGSFELVSIAQALARRPKIDAVVALGCVLTGETSHDRYLCEAITNGLVSITLQAFKPVSFGVLTCQTLQQAEARAGGDKGNKGAEAMRAAIAAANECDRISKSRLSKLQSASQHRLAGEGRG